MTYDVAIFGDLLSAEAELRRWKRAEIGSRGNRAIAKAFPGSKNDAPQKQVALVAELAKAGFFRLEESDGLVRVRGQFHGLAFRKRARALAALFIAAARFGAEGTVTFLGEGVWVGYEIFLHAGRAQLRVMTEDEVRRAAQDPALDMISGHFEAAVPLTAWPQPKDVRD